MNGKTAIILGAGFSKCAALPIQHDFDKLLLSEKFDSSIDKEITKNIKTFLFDVFGCNGSSFPELEDIFTNIDLSASIGHHLGIKYTPKKLRALRRMLIYRIFTIINSQYKDSVDIVKLLNKYVSLDNQTSFVVLNWDIVLEKHLIDTFSDTSIDYSFDSIDWATGASNVTADSIKIFKIHGSSNWVYCENCKNLFYDLNRKMALHNKVGLIKSDFRLFNESLTDKKFDEYISSPPKERKCKICSNTVSTHIATFSYKKSLQNPAYSYIWNNAEKVLSNSNNWIFIGYSLPSADYEFKHLLKNAQLNMGHKNTNKKIDVVYGGNDTTKKRFNDFFGDIDISYHSGGLASFVR